MSYYLFNRQELLQKAKDKYHNSGGKEKAAEYYLQKEEALKRKCKKQVQKLFRRRKRSRKRIWKK